MADRRQNRAMTVVDNEGVKGNWYVNFLYALDKTKPEEAYKDFLERIKTNYEIIALVAALFLTISMPALFLSYDDTPIHKTSLLLQFSASIFFITAILFSVLVIGLFNKLVLKSAKTLLNPSKNKVAWITMLAIAIPVNCLIVGILACFIAITLYQDRFGFSKLCYIFFACLIFLVALLAGSFFVHNLYMTENPNSVLKNKKATVAPALKRKQSAPQLDGIEKPTSATLHSLQP
jgi:hypothetical protein